MICSRQNFVLVALSLTVGLAQPVAVLAQAVPALPSPAAIPAAVPAAVDVQRVDSGISPSSTIIPTDILPLPAVQNRLSFAENFQLRLLQKLPARFYFNNSNEITLRYETNPFQFPTKRKLLTQLPAPPIFRVLNPFQQGQILDVLNLANNDDMVFRILPNVTGGWTVTPRTRVYANYFMIRDQLFHNVRLNTVIHSIGGGIQRDIPITSRGNLQAEFQFRELYQLHQQPVFDYLPGLTFSYVLTPRTVLFANAILQLRGKRPFQAPTREIDPFYTWGMLYQKSGWTFSASSTFVQNFREPFRRNASIPVNNYSFILDFEVSRRIIKALPGLQAFVRAEPIYNFHSHNRPGLAGMDFRLFFGFRMALAKPALTSALEQLRQQLEEQEALPPEEPENKNNQPDTGKPSAYLPGNKELVAEQPQPIHGFQEELEQTNSPIALASSSASSPSSLEPMDVAGQNNPASLPTDADAVSSATGPTPVATVIPADTQTSGNPAAANLDSNWGITTTSDIATDKVEQQLRGPMLTGGLGHSLITPFDESQAQAANSTASVPPSINTKLKAQNASEQEHGNVPEINAQTPLKLAAKTQKEEAMQMKIYAPLPAAEQ